MEPASSGPKPDLPCTIADGDDHGLRYFREHDSPRPFVAESEAAINLTLSSGEWLQIDADQLTIEFTGEPEFIEDFYGR